MRVVKYKDFANEDEEVQWLIEGLLPNTGYTVLIAPEGTGKTRLTLQMCDALERGAPFLGLPTLRTKCVYVQIDSTPIEWREIVRQVVPRSTSLTIVDVPAFWMDDKSGRHVEWFTKAIQQLKPGYVVFDSLYKLCSDINSPNTVGPRLAQIKQMLRIGDVDIPWMVLHHPPQNETRAAGSRSIAADASYTWELTSQQLKVTKGRLRPKQSIAIEMDDKGIWRVYGEGQSRRGDIDLASMIKPPIL